MSHHFKKVNHAETIGKSVLLASIQSSIASVEMSSKFSVLSFSKDQDTLQRAADALAGYIIIGSIWAVGSCLVLYAENGMWGLIYGILGNLVLMGWIIGSYMKAFRDAAKRGGLQVPTIFKTLSYSSTHDGMLETQAQPMSGGNSEGFAGNKNMNGIDNYSYEDNEYSY
jgi:hypothetical protein